MYDALRDFSGSFFKASTENLGDRFCAFRKHETSGSVVALWMWFPGLGTQLVSLTDTDTVFLKSHAKCSLQSYLSGCWFSVYNCYDLHQGYWLPIFTLYLGMLTITMESLWKVQAVLHRASGPKKPLENLALIFFRENNRICFFELKYPFIQIKALLSSGDYSREQER